MTIRMNWGGYNRVIESARQHGDDSANDHEVGDLQDALKIAWETMHADQRKLLVERFFAEVSDEEDAK